MVQQRFEKIGFKATWHELPSSMQRAGTLILQRQGAQRQTYFTDWAFGYRFFQQ